jgi:hypothetical protein
MRSCLRCRPLRRLPKLCTRRLRRRAGDDLLALVLASLPPSALAAAEATCRRWAGLINGGGLWQRHAEAAEADAAAALAEHAAYARGAHRTSGGGGTGGTSGSAGGAGDAGSRAVSSTQPSFISWKERYLEARVGASCGGGGASSRRHLAGGGCDLCTGPLQPAAA